MIWNIILHKNITLKAWKKKKALMTLKSQKSTLLFNTSRGVHREIDKLGNGYLAGDWAFKSKPKWQVGVIFQRILF